MGKDGKVITTPSSRIHSSSKQRRPLESEVLDYEAAYDELKPLSYRSLKVFYPPGYQHKKNQSAMSSKFFNRIA